MTAPDSWTLVQAAQRGDMTAYAQLWRDYRPAVFRFALAQTDGDYHRAEDITSETFTRALNRIHTMVRPDNDAGAWFNTIARNIILDQVKSSRHNREILIIEPIDIPFDDDPADRTIRDETATRVQCLVRETLTDNPDQLDCIQQRFFKNRTVPETAAAMGRTSSAVKMLQVRALRNLHRRINPTGTRARQICENTTCDQACIGLYCCTTCQQNSRVALGNPSPGTRCAIPSCRRRLTESQQHHHALVCSRRCWDHLNLLRGSVAA